MVRFATAEKALTEGSKVRRNNWPEGNYIVLLSQGRKSYLMHFRFKTQSTEPQVLYWDDIKAKNWEIVP